MKAIHKEMLLASLEKFNTCDVTVGGTSMWPFIKSGDIVSITQKPFRPALGQVVAFFVDSRLITHRVIWYRKTGHDTWLLTVHGDASPLSLTHIESDQVVGTVMHLKRNTRKLSRSFEFPFRVFAIPFGIVLQLIIALKLILRYKKL
jgi:hypothetical protein